MLEGVRCFSLIHMYMYISDYYLLMLILIIIFLVLLLLSIRHY